MAAANREVEAVPLLHLPGSLASDHHQGMQGLSVAAPPHYIGSFVADPLRDQSGAYDLGELEQPLSFGIDGGSEHSFERRSAIAQARNTLNILPAGPVRFDNTPPNNKQHPGSSQVTSPSAASTDSRFSQYTSSGRGGIQPGFESPTSRLDNWGDSRTTDNNSPRTDTSTDMETNVIKSEQNQQQAAGAAGSNHHHRREHKNLDAKALRRLAQNREAARKSRLRKKAYVQQLESSRMKLNQLEQELQRARQQQGFYVGAGGYGEHLAGANAPLNPGAAAFDMDYARWLEEQHRQLCELRSALQSHVADNELRVLVDNGLAHYDEIFRMKSVAAKADVFHLVSGMWKSPAERCFMWMGGFRPSELLKILIPQLEPLTEQQLMGICNLQQSSQQAEDALSQGMEALQQSLSDTLASGSLGASSNVANYMGQMAMAMGKLGTLENFVRQADNLRQQTLQQMHRILTTRQAARGLLAMGDYFARLRALSSLWSARPRE
ncbi:transcription factor TGA2.3 isoform X2 [Selaginella moellendorffii]|uniref:transcription factor TGA2.3 isoform X2 n=1 Tax=Selaginella moellendorffii TaxID=88036 RepID=UPI000D1CFF87|nr:transcription factor TGA2.3 isoform X2 [Selaginella moellendorffii]|eukprot:XP_024536796.1 transcription factor TGA2.3 isoform X2 [Selaginella moellendorffii]